MDEPKVDISEADLALRKKAIALIEAAEFTMRTCWECNTGHEHFKSAEGLIHCLGCGKWCLEGQFVK